MSTVRMDGANVYKNMESLYEMAQDGKNNIQQERANIVNDPDMSVSEKRAALEKLDNAEKAYDKVISNSTQESGLFGVISKDLTNKTENDVNASWKMLEKAEQAMQQFAKLTGKDEASSMSNVDPPSKNSGADGTGETKASDDDKKAAQNKAYDTNFKGKTPEDLANWASADPQAFYGAMRDLSPEDRQMTMMMMNQYLQDMNQMFSMMSNLSKAMHDTAKALISNMRV